MKRIQLSAASGRVDSLRRWSRQTSTQTVQHVWVNHDSDLLDVTLASDPSGSQPATQQGTSKQQQAAVKSRGLRAPPTEGNGAGTSASSSAPATTETVHTTANHPWLSADRGWVAAGQLAAGEQVVRADGSTATVVGVQVVPGSGTMYNLTVSHLHTYAVGASQYVVHNSGCFGGNSGNTPAAQTGKAFHGDRLNGGSPDNYGGPSQLQDIYPNTEFEFTPNGGAGPDVEVVGGQHPSTYGRGNWPAGANRADFKPATRQGRAELRSQMRNNPGSYPSDTVPIWYDQGLYQIVGIGW